MERVGHTISHGVDVVVRAGSMSEHAFLPQMTMTDKHLHQSAVDRHRKVHQNSQGCPESLDRRASRKM